LIASGSTHSLPVIPTQLYSSLYGFFNIFYPSLDEKI